MKKLAVILSLYSGLFSQASLSIPFDWAGQNGFLIKDGALLWNRDWSSGMLLFDGTYTSYPLRFGSHTSSLFQPVKLGNLPSWRALPDSNNVESYFDYYRGDYAFDQLEIGANYEQLNKYLGVRGFKRSHGGNTGHYFYPGGGSSPIHHSYRIDYGAIKGKRRVEVSAGRFITRSGLPDSTSNGFENDNILSAGARLKQPIGQWIMDVYFAQFFQHRLSNHSSVTDSSYQNINRNQLEVIFQSPGGIGFGVNHNSQQINADTTNRFLRWSTIFASKKIKYMNILIGVNQIKNEDSKFPLSWQFDYQKEMGDFYTNIVTSGFPKPIHPTLDDSDGKRFYEFWNHSMVKGGFINQKVRGDIFVSMVYRNKSGNETRDSNIQFIGGNLQYGWKNGWNIYTKIISQLDTSIYGGGIGTSLTTGINGNFNFFKDYLIMDAHLWADGSNGKLKTFGFDPIEQIPFINTNSDWILSDQWLLHFEVVANISHVLVSYKVDNILNAVGSMAGASPNDLIWIRPNHIYPQLGRMMQFGVTWYFND
jgi:hypothetical protein